MGRALAWGLGTVIALLLAALQAFAQVSTTPCVQPASNKYLPYADEAITISNGSVNFLTSSKVAPTGGATAAQMVQVTNMGAGLALYRLSGTAPTTTAGAHISAGTTVYVCGAHAASAIEFLAVNSDVTLFNVYYRVQ